MMVQGTSLVLSFPKRSGTCKTTAPHSGAQLSVVPHRELTEILDPRVKKSLEPSWDLIAKSQTLQPQTTFHHNAFSRKPQRPLQEPSCRPRLKGP